MRQLAKRIFTVFLGVLTCGLIVGLSSAPSLSRDMPQTTPSELTQWLSDVPAEAIIAGEMGRAMKQYSVTLSSSAVVPNAPTTSATGMAEAKLKGDRLMVKGRFMTLSSELRDYVADPVNPPNPKITSAVHIHRGAATENGPFQFALTVKLDKMGMGGQFSGEYTLSPEQLQALTEGKLYIDLHTKQNRAGELRGYFRPA